MLSNQVLQKTVNDMGRITQTKCAVFSMEGKCLTPLSNADKVLAKSVTAFLEAVKEDYNWAREQIDEEYSLFLICDEEYPAYILAMENAGQDQTVSGRLCVNQLENLIRAYKERLDKNHFIQNLLLDNLLLVDVYNQAKKLRIENEERRAVFLIEPKREDDNIVIETLKGLYATGTKDFVTAVDEGHVILVKALETTDSYKDLNHIAKAIVDTMNTEAMVNVRVAYGTIVKELKEVSKSYKESSMALDVGRIFYVEKNVLAYNELGIGRLIHQLPVSLCDMFLKEVFDSKDVEQFDEETLATVHKFFENNLNISETARQLFVHRNTLVYRLEKIQKTTGLDVRVFDDALTFKIALMVASHMEYVQKKD